MKFIPRADSSLIYYGGKNYADGQTGHVSVQHGGYGEIASSSGHWTYQSVAMSSMQSLVLSHVDTAAPSTNYLSHKEEIISANIPDLTALYMSAQFPLNFLGIDPLIAAIVWLDIPADLIGDNAMAASSLVGGSTTTINTLSLPGRPGVVGAIATTQSSSVVANCQYGQYDSTTGLVTWTGGGNLVLQYLNGVVTLLSSDGFPTNWTFGAPTRQADGSWSISLNAGDATNRGILYSQQNYSGSALNVSPHQQVNINTGAGWSWLSARLYTMPVLLYSSFDPANISWNYQSSQLLRLTSDTPDFRTIFTGAFPVDLLSLDNTDVQISVRLNTTASNNAVLVSALNWPVSFSAATLQHATGLLALTQASGSETVTLHWGSLNGDGTANLTSSGTVTVTTNQGMPIIVPGAGIPSDWVFAPPVQQADGSWLCELTDQALPATVIVTSLTSNKTTLIANGSDRATLTATVVDTAGLYPVAAIPLEWITDLGNLDFSSNKTNTSGVATNGLTSAQAGVITVICRLPNGNSKSVNIDASAATTQLKVMGARASHHASGQYQAGRLVAFDSATSLQTEALWRYRGSSSYSVGHSFIDTEPFVALDVVFFDGTNVTLAPSNIIGNGSWTDTNTSSGSFAARLSDRRVIAWGDPAYGGSTPSLAENYSVTGLAATFTAFCALRSNGTLFAWGESDEGGDIPSAVASRSDIVDIQGSRGTFVIRGSNSPYIASWGWATEGGEAFSLSVPGTIASKSDIHLLRANDNAMAAVSLSGNVFAWGDSTAGGSVPSSISSLSGISDCCASRRAFAVISTGRIYAWGDVDYGSSASSVSSVYNASRLVSTESAFTALLSNSQIVCWGNSTYGGVLPSEYAQRNNIVDVKGSYGAFAALCSDGTVFAWGNSEFGGDIGSAAPFLFNVVALTANAGSFAALKKDGSVVTWGNAAYGGNSLAVASQLNNVCAIYSNTHAFIALKADNTVVAWGELASGVANIPLSQLNGNISYYAA